MSEPTREYMREIMEKSLKHVEEADAENAALRAQLAERDARLAAIAERAAQRYEVDIEGEFGLLVDIEAIAKGETP